MRRIRTFVPWFVAAAAVPVSLVAGTVVLPHAFANGSVADASHVNANFGAMKTAHDALDGRIAALEASAGLNTVRFLAAPTNINITCNGGNQLKSGLNPNVPAGSTAVLATVTTYAAARSDHVVHSFGRNAAHSTNSYDNGVATNNTWMNDVLLSHNGESAGPDYYGRSHGTQIVPLKANGTFDAMTCMGHSSGVHNITLQVFGYVK